MSILLGALAIGYPSRAEGRHRAGPCQPRLHTTSTLFRNREGRVVLRPDKDYIPVYACLYRVGRFRELSNDYDIPEPLFQIRAPYATYFVRGDAGERVVVTDLRTNLAREAVYFGEYDVVSGDEETEGAPELTSLVLTRGGHPAWITRAEVGDDPRSPEYVYRVQVPRRVPQDQSPSPGRVVASGRNIAPRSLRLEGRSVTWVQGGSRRRALLLTGRHR